MGVGVGWGMYWPQFTTFLASVMCFIDVGYRFLFQVINMYMHGALEKSSE